MEQNTIFIIIGNIISGIAYLAGILSIRSKTKDSLLKVDLMTSGLSLLSFCFLLSLSGILNTIITLLRIQTIRYKEIKNKNFYLLFIVFLIFYMSVFIDYKGLETILLFTSSMFSFIPKWFSKNLQVIRFTGICACFTIIYWQLSILNYTGMMFSIISILINAIGLYKNRKPKIK